MIFPSKKTVLQSPRIIKERKFMMRSWRRFRATSILLQASLIILRLRAKRLKINIINPTKRITITMIIMAVVILIDFRNECYSSELVSFNMFWLQIYWVFKYSSHFNLLNEINPSNPLGSFYRY